MKISFKTKENPEVRSFEVSLPTDLAGLTAAYGEESVCAAALSSYAISLQSTGRRHIEKSDEEIQDILDAWNPNERSAVTKQTPFEKASSALAKLSPEEKADLLAKLRAG